MCLSPRGQAHARPGACAGWPPRSASADIHSGEEPGKPQ
ncbi:hypothetical protein L515_1189 [Bordetella bronchiseptica MBORD665]|nr:hypothetical protein L516_1116 [Bordetella bronchiseptica MBORD668]KDC88193.1 hypothetical protein L515_1189 [Bordetella bronchiseptica MBORD665]